MLKRSSSPLLQRLLSPLMAYALCAALAVAAMGWATQTILRLERHEREAQRQAALEENVRLALWRMDSFLGPVIALEAARPYFTYSAYYPAARAYGQMFAQPSPGEALVASPLLAAPPPLIRLYFQIQPNGTFESPQLPPESLSAAGEKRSETTRRLQEVQAMLNGASLASLLPKEIESPSSVFQPLVVFKEQASAQVSKKAKGQQDFELRQYSNMFQSTNSQLSANGILDVNLATQPTAGTMQPLWIGSELILARRVRIDSAEYLQGCWLDWPAVRQQLLGGVRDLLPGANLVASKDQAPNAIERRLASIPASLVPGALPDLAGKAAISPMRIALIAAWAALLAAIAAIGMLLIGTLSLSRRRGAFVSAVTHELRTPMTTFRLYTDLLAGDMVKDEAQRRTYLETLRSEAERLGRLIENVLIYARLERGRQTAHLETLHVSDLLNKVADRLIDRAAQSSMTLTVENVAKDALAVRTDISTVEQILMNLVDNACKYAGAEPDISPNDPRRHLHLRACVEKDAVLLSLQDHGPGISRAEARRLFQPFHKSAHEAANSSSGVGLGLALSRRLARTMGGDLQLEKSPAPGACFMLRLPCDL